MILDTNAISAMSYEVRRAEDKEIERVLQEASHPYLSVPVLAEYRYGLINSRRQQSLETWLGQLQSSWPVLVLDVLTAHHYGIIKNQLSKKGRMIPVNDIWIAALALQHHLPILSEDRHFDAIDGVQRIGWKKRR
ncbi:MAG: type II toxin-antitoxin system VapC family toxin [Chthoniobacterales bacterium]|nr:type II toxin-antitoxin system VapC family toxin [Chthoniobacterales bacterium]